MLSKTPCSARVRIRSIRADDRDELSRFYAALSSESRLARFHAVSLGIGDAAARLLCGPDHEHREGFIAEPTGASSIHRGAARIVGHLCLEPSASGFEMAVAVADDWQAQGIGRALMLAAVDWATSHGIDRIHASALSSNSAVLGLIASIGRPVRESMSSAGVVEVAMHIGGTRLNAA
jgi:GNAT superfamily N-acetyltransferase